MTDALTILITNHNLSARAGSELYVRDLATALLARGHRPIVYSPALGRVAAEIRAASIPVIDDLDRLAASPDVIHGHHHLETMTAVLHFAGTPAIYVCHGWLPWEEAAPRFPSILQYVAVDDTCRDRLVCEGGIPDERVRVLLNFVDLARFPQRSPLPPRPVRGLLFCNENGPHGAVVREACAQAGVSLDGAGLGHGSSVVSETVLGGYDIVFAKARSALEALAVGAAVVLVGANGMGPMVTTSNVDRLRRLNFGIRALGSGLTPARLMAEIHRYDPADAAAVSGGIRATAGRDAAVDELLSLYRTVIADWRYRPGQDLRSDGRAVAEYLRSLSPALKGSVSEREAARTKLAGLEAEKEQLCGQLLSSRAEMEHLASRLSAALDTTANMERSLFWKTRLAWVKARDWFPR
ncbi:MAG: glycosyltransferase [Acidobacteriota bacterium]